MIHKNNEESMSIGSVFGILIGLGVSENLFEEDIAVGLLKISIVVLKFLMHLEPTRLIEPLAHLIKHLHMQVNTIGH